jgi:hypothetical protein
MPSELTLLGITLGKSMKQSAIPKCATQDKQMDDYHGTFDDHWGCKGFMCSYQPLTFPVYFKDLTIPKNCRPPDECPVARIEITFAVQDAPKLLELLKGKFGDPINNKTSIVQNLSGARFEKYEMKWNVGENELYMTNMHENIETGYLYALWSEAVKKRKELEQQDKQRI